VLIFDLGGGTFDVSLLSIDEGMFEVKATAGDTHLGGEDFDNLLVDHFVQEIKRKHKKDIQGNNKALRRLRTQCERAKRVLSVRTRAAVEVESLVDGVDFASNITRAKFEDLCSKYFKGCIAPVQKVLSDAKMNKDDIAEIVLVGGSTRIPKVQEMITEFFGREPNKSINPDEAVAYGAAIQAGLLSGSDMGDHDQLVLVDVTPLSLGIETAGGVMAKLIPRNSTIPCRESQIFTTFVDHQPGVDISIYEGEREFCKDNNLLGKFCLHGIQKAPRGVPQILVTFDLDSNGILSVAARDQKDPSLSGNIKIDSQKGRMSPDEIKKILVTAEENKEKDSKEKQRVASRQVLQNLAYHIVHSLDDPKYSDLLTPDDVKKLKAAAKATFDWVDTHQNASLGDFMEQRKKLDAVWKPYVDKAYEAQQKSDQSQIAA